MCSAAPGISLLELHKSLGHPSYARFITSFVSVISAETKTVCKSCHTCAEVKPQFFKPASQTLIKAVRRWNRISVDFNGPVSGPHPYLLIVVDEHSRFPFAFPCKNMKLSTVTLCLSSLFCLFGFPGCVHSDRGAPFVSLLDPSSPLVASPSVPQLRTIHRGTASANALTKLSGEL